MNCGLKVSKVFSDHMVLQRDKDIPVWGTAKSGSKIEVEFCGQKGETVAENGGWQIKLSPLEAGGPFDMIIRSGSSVIELKDILIGEVWLAGGQSNMEFILENSLNGKAEIFQANNESIRCFHVPRIEYEDENTVVEDVSGSGWKLCAPENAGAFSAVAYYFAKSIQEEIKVPVGIINCSWGGTSASCWMSREYIESDGIIKVYLDEFNESVKHLSDEEADKEQERYNHQVKVYSENLEKFKLANPDAAQQLIDNSIGSYPWPPPLTRKTFMRPAGLYYTMLKKIVPYALRGFIYYQGEGDTHKPELYQQLLSRLIENWREDWNDGNLPFLFVQLPMYGCDGNPDGREWAVLREKQLLTAQNVKNTAMAIAIDCGEIDNIHPVDKKPVGNRLAHLAKAKVYGRDMEYTGPVYNNMRIENDKIILCFEHADNGLKMVGDELTGFEICGEDRKFTAAKAEISGNTVEVYAEGINSPAAVRYGWANYVEVNLYNTAGLPAGPFRTEVSSQ